MQKLSIIIPSFNEQATIISVLNSIISLSLQIPYEVIVVDDGSIDTTWDLLSLFQKKHKKIQIHHHTTNQGKGAAIQTGIQKATGDYILIQDSDTEYHPADIPKLVDYIINTGAPAVYGSRNLTKTGRGAMIYYVGGIFLSIITNIIYRQELTDVSTGYKLFQKSKIQLPFNEKRFGVCYEITIQLARNGFKIPEIPIQYSPRTKKEGKKITFFDGLHAIVILLTNYHFKW